jgi:hypothetical protein
LSFAVSFAEGVFEWAEPWVELHNAWDHELSAVSLETASLPVPSFGRPFAAPPFMAELTECSLTLSIFAFLWCFCDQVVGYQASSFANRIRVQLSSIKLEMSILHNIKRK